MTKNETGTLKIVDISRPVFDTPISLPTYLSPVQAGFPSPAEDYIERQLDINELVIQHPAATFFVRVEGESMCDADIHTGDILVVDRSIQATSGKIVVAIINGEFTVKRYVIKESGHYLIPENNRFPPIKISEESDFQVWGIVTYVIHKTR